MSGSSYPVGKRSQTSQSLRTSEEKEEQVGVKVEVEEEEEGEDGFGETHRYDLKKKKSFHATPRLVLRKNIVIIHVSSGGSDRQTDRQMRGSVFLTAPLKKKKNCCVLWVPPKGEGEEGGGE